MLPFPQQSISHLHIFFAILQVNSDPYKGGWFLKVKVSNKGDLDKLLDASAYEKHCADGGH